MLLLLGALAALVWLRGWVEVPDDWNPWAPLDIAAEPNVLTGFKLARATADDARCMDALEAAPFRWQPLEDRRTGPDCGFFNAVRIERTSVRVGEAFSLSCRAAVSLALWETHVLQQAAAEHLGQEVVAIEHFGSYACRNVYGRENARRSQHATADAWDIAGFVLADGRRVRVIRDWAAPTDDAPDPPAAFLRDVHRGACRFFDAVLGPEYNQAHADHFHFDRGRWRICR